MDIVFISYAREDKSLAERLYMDLRKNEISAWIDTKCLLPGENWHNTIRKTIKASRFFLLLISKYSVNKRGYVQREIKEALKIKEEFPTDEIFLIPIRLDETIPIDEDLQNLNWVDLNKSYNNGLRRILTVFTQLEKEPIKDVSDFKTAERRAPIAYKPFDSFEDFIRQFIDRLPTSTLYTDTEISYYITFKTTDLGNTAMPEYLRQKYPQIITIVLQNIYSNLKLLKTEGFSVDLQFNGKKEFIAVAFKEILKIESPELNLRIERL